MPGDVADRRARVFLVPVRDEAGMVTGGVVTAWPDDAPR
jgi:hypothetical protein